MTLASTHTVQWTDSQKFDMRWDSLDQMIYFDLNIKPDTWFALIFGKAEGAEHDMIMWQSETKQVVSSTPEFITTTTDCFWLGLPAED